MRRQEILETIARHRDELREYGVESLALFGSVSREEAAETSDIDILVEFSRPVGMLAFLRLQHRLAEILGRKVDLVTPRALRPAWRERILSEAVHAG
jgi:predicted nucleotidyltransferase|uniref:Nucleotidyltransferase n=1 Tax=Desulfobacca acetoxidans TaxID=60893 RepID=A0A7C3Z394_9BACT